jgi:hypothetical protein
LLFVVEELEVVVVAALLVPSPSFSPKQLSEHSSLHPLDWLRDPFHAADLLDAGTPRGAVVPAASLLVKPHVGGLIPICCFAFSELLVRPTVKLD